MITIIIVAVVAGVASSWITKQVLLAKIHDAWEGDVLEQAKGRPRRWES